MYMRFRCDICAVDIIIKLFEAFVYSKSVEFICQLKRTTSVNNISLSTVVSINNIPFIFFTKDIVSRDMFLYIKVIILLFQTN